MHHVFERFETLPSRVLIVDPDQVSTQHLTRLLRPLYQVESVPSGTSALQRLALFRPTLILLEFDLPDMSGVDLIGRVQRQFPTPPIAWIMTTTRQSIADKVASFQAGAVDYLIKPLRLDTLSYRINNAYRFYQMTLRQSTIASPGNLANGH
jgi:DNA-binding response OmpR family regulator